MTIYLQCTVQTLGMLDMLNAGSKSLGVAWLAESLCCVLGQDTAQCLTQPIKKENKLGEFVSRLKMTILTDCLEQGISCNG